jgi:NADH:ubiquinone oxidoreductase subunit E
MSKDAYYFNHDSNARNDIKILKLRRQLGLEGYGAYWCIIEILRDTAGYKLPISAIDDIAHDINIAREKLEAIVLNYSLFEIEENMFFSSRLCRSMEIYNESKKRLSESGKKGMESRWNKQTNKKPNPNSFI